MELKELLDFIEIENERLKKHFSVIDPEKYMLARTVKIAEEVGELSNEVLAFNKMQRQDKLDKHSKENLSEEFADVILTALLLADTMGVDMERALKAKMEKVNKRYETSC